MHPSLWLAAGLLTLAHAVHATEGGGSLYAQGTENFMTGAAPPPGMYGLLYANHYRTDRMNDAQGRDMGVPGFKVRATVLAPRFVWSTQQQVLGGNVVAHVVVPLVRLEAQMMGMRYNKTGVGDITVGVGLGFHHSPHWHSAVGVDVFLPTGSYDRNNFANIGRNYAGFEPVYAFTYVDPKGFNGDMRIGYLINRRNSATDYTSGDEFHFDYSAGWGLGNGWTVGVGGHYLQQTSADRQAGARLADSKTRSFSIGPNLKYDSGKGWFVTAKWQVETQARNATQGQALWIKAVMPL